MRNPLERYRRIGGRRYPGWVVAAVVLWWTVSLVSGYRFAPDPEAATSDLLRVTEAEWVMTLETVDAPEWVRWLVFEGDVGKARRDAIETLEMLDARVGLTEQGSDALRVMRHLERGEAFEKGELQRWAGRWEHRRAWSWELEAIERTYGRRVPHWALLEMSHWPTWRERISFLWCAGEALWWAAVGVGLPFIPAALRCFRPSRHVSEPRLTRHWSPAWLVPAVLCLSLASTVLLTGVYLVAYPPPVWIDAFDIVVDGLWRMSVPMALIPLCFARWRHGWRILGLDRPPKLAPLLGMLPLVALYDLLLYLVFDAIGWLDPTAVYLDGDGVAGLILAITSGVILAPLCEEIVYRGVLFQALRARLAFWGAALASTLFFVLIHFYDLHGSLSVASFGIVACALFRATGSLWTAILYHAVVNGLIVASQWPVYNGVYGW